MWQSQYANAGRTGPSGLHQTKGSTDAAPGFPALTTRGNPWCALNGDKVSEFGSRKLLAVLAVLGLEMTFPEVGVSGTLDELRRERGGAWKLNVHVLGRHVGVLEQIGDFKSVMTYVPDVAPENLISLTMPVRTESYPWDDQLHPIFQMNLPAGYLLQVLQEEFGPHIGASSVALLSVIGRNMVGRLQVAPPGAAVDEPAKPIEVAELLKGDNSEEAFSQLVREHAKSGVSGVLPKFLDTEQETTSRLGSYASFCC